MQETDCETAEILSRSLSLKLALFFKTFFCFWAVVASIYSLVKEGVSWLAHPNAKALFCFHSFWAIYLPLCYFFNCGFDAVRLVLYQNTPCQLMISTKYAVPLRAVPVLGLISQSFTMCAFALERALATASPRKYEKVKKPWLGLFLGFLAFVAGLTEEIYFIILPNKWRTKVAISTIRTDDNAEQYMTFLHSYSIVEFITITTFIISLWANNRRRRQNSRYGNGLSRKYQLHENKHIIETLLPCFLIHFCVNIIPMLGIQFYIMIYKPNAAEFTTYVEWSVQMHLYSIIMPAVVKLKLHLRKSKQITDSHNTNAHFNQLRSMFDKPVK